MPKASVVQSPALRSWRIRESREKRHQRGKLLGWIGVLLLVEACVEQFFPGDSFVKGHRFFLAKDVIQSLAAAVFAYKACILDSKRWIALFVLTALNAILTLSAGMSLGPDDFLNFVQNLYPPSTKREPIRRVRSF